MKNLDLGEVLVDIALGALCIVIATAGAAISWRLLLWGFAR